MFFKVILILPPVWCSDLLINNIVQLGLADTKIVSQDAVNKVLELTEKMKIPKLHEVNSNSVLEICCKHDASPQSLGSHDSSAFYVPFYHFLFLR